MSTWSTSSFDDIVVGAGSAGAVIAARLSEDPGRRVLLIEAGNHYPNLGSAPDDLRDGNAMSLVRHSWGFGAQLTDQRRVMFPLGRTTGGSSAVGNTVAIRGTPADYDEWAALGNPLWSWNHVLPAFKKLEDDLDYFRTDVHGSGGPTPIRRWMSEELTPVQAAFSTACIESGIPWHDDHNHPESTGVGPIPSNRRDDRTRVSTAGSYLWPASKRSNLTILPRTVTDRVEFQGEVPVGVRVRVDGGEPQVINGRRVILSAGAIGSPAILLRSGIGPSDELARHHIEARTRLDGVGRGLTDQPRIGVFMSPRPGNENTGKSTGQIVARTTESRFNDEYYAMVNSFDLTWYFPELRRVSGAQTVFGVMAVLRRQHARGEVRLASPHPLDAPEIDLGFLKDERDYQLIMNAVRRSWRLAQHPEILGRGEQLVGIDEKGIEDDETLRSYIERSVDSGFNPVGTTRMGPASDPLAVVDETCQIHTVPGLHVIDASVMPSMICANTHLTVVMIAERAAELLRAAE